MVGNLASVCWWSGRGVYICGMPDISMCDNQECPSRFGCYRFLAEPDAWQMYARFKFDESGKCVHFWPARPDDLKVKPRRLKMGESVTIT